MSSPRYERLEVEEDVPSPQDPPPYPESELHKEPDVSKSPAGPVTPTGYGAYPPEPPPYQPNYSPNDEGPKQGPFRQQPRTIVITPVEPSEEPDYMAYSICTTFCCCLVLGAFAILFSRRTQNANRVGDVASARKNSRIALILSLISLGVGLVLHTLYTILLMTSSR